MQEIEVVPMKLDQLYELLPVERVAQFEEQAARARSLLHGGVVWNVSATAHGGGVAEMLQTLLSYVRGVGVETRWLVLSGSPALFTVTKRVHNMLHGEPGDGGPLGPAELAAVLAALAADVEDLVARVSPGDVVLLHDPQTAGMVEPLRAAGRPRGVALPRRAGRLERADRPGLGVPPPAAAGGRRLRLLPGGLRPRVVPAGPVARHRALDRPAQHEEPCPQRQARCRRPSCTPGSSRAPTTTADLTFVRRDGGAGSVRRHRDLVTDGGPVPAAARLVVQVSRWDRLKDMAGVLRGFVAARAALPGDVHLVLAGPDPSCVSDDPEGAAVLASAATCGAGWPAPSVTGCTSSGCRWTTVDENAHLVNALQRRATVSSRRASSRASGSPSPRPCGRSRPVVASAVGGIQDQIVDGRTGWLLSDPTDLAGLGATLAAVLGDPAGSAAVAAAGRASVHRLPRRPAPRGVRRPLRPSAALSAGDALTPGVAPTATPNDRPGPPRSPRRGRRWGSAPRCRPGRTRRPTPPSTAAPAGPAARPRPRRRTPGNVHDASRALELGIATGIGAIGPGIGVGFIFGKTIEAVGRQPEMRGQLQGLMWLGFALTEAIIFYALGMAFVAYAIA